LNVLVVVLVAMRATALGLPQLAVVAGARLSMAQLLKAEQLTLAVAAVLVVVVPEQLVATVVLA
jgi:hypothetical protein